MTDLAAERGYPDVTVEGLLTRAHVSKPTFYRLFSSKEDCFDAAFDRASAGAISWLEEETLGAVDKCDLLERALSGLSAILRRRPSAVRLVLQEPISVGERAVAQMRATERRCVDLFRRRFAQLEPSVDLPPVIARGMVSGIGWIARWHLNGGSAAEFADDAPELIRWLSAVSEVATLRRFQDQRPSVEVRTPDASAPPAMPAIPAEGERALLVNAATRLFLEHGYEGLTPGEIARVAGVPARRAKAYFGTAADCLAAAVELGAAAAMAAAKGAYRAGPPGPSGVGRAIDALSLYLALNPGVARLLFVEIFGPGRRVTRRGAGILSALALVLIDRLPEGARPSRPSAEASVGAIWCLIRYEVEEDSLCSLLKLSPILTWFALAPSVAESGGLFGS